jgi:hypothetical protein
MKQHDLEKNGVISLEEFKALMLGISGENYKEEMM